MKLRIKGNSIRFRLGRTEVAALIEKGFFSEETRFTGDSGGSFYYGLILSDEIEKVEAKFEGDRIMVVLPGGAARDWAEDDNVGIEAVQDELNILVEKDFVCHGRPGDPDNADAFLSVPPAVAGG
jgi:hypothetical protein